MTVVAVDCDLRKVYGWSNTCGAICTKASSVDDLVHYIAGMPVVPTVLFEVASALDYTDSKAVAHNKRRWTIWNIATCVRLFDQLARVGFPAGNFLVAPSHVWTRGYPIEVRHKLAKADAKNKDLRECQSMIFMYHLRRADWVSLPAYLDAV